MTTEQVLLALGALPMLWWGVYLVAGIFYFFDHGNRAQVTMRVSGWPILIVAALTVCGLVGIVMALGLHVTIS